MFRIKYNIIKERFIEIEKISDEVIQYDFLLGNLILLSSDKTIEMKWEWIEFDVALVGTDFHTSKLWETTDWIEGFVQMIFWHLLGNHSRRVCNGGRISIGVIEMRASDSLLPILVVEKKRHGNTWPKTVRQRDRLPQTHYSRRPAVIQ